VQGRAIFMLRCGNSLMATSTCVNMLATARFRHAPWIDNLRRESLLACSLEIEGNGGRASGRAQAGRGRRKRNMYPLYICNGWNNARHCSGKAVHVFPIASMSIPSWKPE